MQRHSDLANVARRRIGPALQERTKMVARSLYLVCSAESCDRPYYALGLCQPHWMQRRAGKDLKPIRKITKRGKNAERNENGEKFCARGNHWLSVDKFSSHAGTIDRLFAECKTCSGLAATARAYNVTVEWILEQRSGRCPLCSGSLERSAIDHDHTCCSGRRSCGRCVRGMICQDCNNGLGMFRDNPDALRRAAKYLEDYRDR